MRAVLIAVLVLLFALPARAKPMSSRLDQILKDCPTIVIARFVAPPARASGAPMPAAYQLVVERSLRGKVATGRFSVKPAPEGHPYWKDGTRLVAFVNGANEWIASAHLLAGPSLEDGVLRLSGFYDFNAHLVSPGVATLAQLEALVAKGTPMRWTFRGPILVGSKRGIVASSIVVAATTPAAKVTGMPKLAGFAKPTVEVGSWDGDDVIVTWERTLRRPLSLRGAATGKNADGSIAVEYRTDDPDLLSEPDLVKYVGDARLGHPYYAFELRVGARKLPVVLGEHIGRLGKLGPVELVSLSMSPERALRTRTATITLEDQHFRPKSSGATNRLVEELMSGPIRCTYAEHGGSTPCSLTYVETRFAVL